MLTQKNGILEFKQYGESDKMPYVIYADIESLIRKIDGCADNPEKSSRRKIGKHIACVYSMWTIWGLDHMENKYTLYRGKGCMKKFYDSVKKRTKNVILLEGKKCYR